MIYYILGFLLGLTPAACWFYYIQQQPCGLTAEAWQECRQPAPDDQPTWPLPITDAMLATKQQWVQLPPLLAREG